MPPRVLEPPVHSLDPADWWMYSDLLQDANAPKDVWLDSVRVANSLDKSKEMTLVLHCPENSLQGHWLRVGSTWFLPVDGTYVSYVNDFRWWRPTWVRKGFERYPCSDKSSRNRIITRMIRYASGTPMQHGYADFAKLKEKFGDKVVSRFFETHGKRKLPADWA